MNFKRSYAIMLRQFFLLRGSPARIVPYFLWSILDIILWGFIVKFFSGLPGTAALYVGTLLGAIILWNFFTRTMHGITTAFFEDVWSSNFLNTFGSPILLREYIFGLTATSIVTTAITFIVMVVMAAFFFDFSFVFLGLSLLPFLLILSLIGIAFGIFAVGIVLRLGPSAEWFIWPIPAVLTPFVGVMYPISILPDWMQAIAHVLPPSYVFSGMRSIVTTGTFAASDLLIAVALALVYIALAYWFLRSIYRYTLRTGLLARYSAESVVP